MTSLVITFLKKIIRKMAKIRFFSSKINLLIARKMIFKIFLQLLKVKITYILNIYIYIEVNMLMFLKKYIKRY